MSLLSGTDQAQPADRVDRAQVGATRSWLFLFLVLALATGLRVWRLADPPLWWDEGNNAYFAHCTLSELVRDATRTHETNPPLHRLALGLWLAIWGDGAFQLRSLSVLSSVLTVLLLYAWGREYGGARTGLVAALLYALAPMAVYYGREAKGYAFCTLWVVLASYVWWRRCRKAGASLWAWGAVGLSWLLALGSHYYAALALAAQGLWVFGEQARRPRSKEQWGVTLRWLGVTALALGLLSIWIVPTWRSALSGGNKPPDDGAVSGVLAYGWRMVRVLVAGPFGADLVTWAGMVLLLTLVVVACSRRRSESQVWLWLLLAGLPLAIGYIAQLAVPFQYPRFFSYVLPFVCLLTAAGSESVGRLGDLLVVGLLVCWFVALPAAFGPRVADEEDMRPLAADMDEIGAEDTPIVVSYIWQEGILRSYLRSDRSYSLGWFCREDVCEQLTAQLSDERGLWLVTYKVPLRHETNTGGWWLERNALRASMIEHGMGRAAFYLPIPTETPNARVVFVGGLALCYTPVDDTVEAGMPVAFGMSWMRGEEASSGAQQQTVYCHLLDAQGRVVAQADGAPRNGLAPLGSLQPGEVLADARAVVVPVDAAPGVYRLRVGVYNAPNGERLLTSWGCDDGVDMGIVRVVDG